MLAVLLAVASSGPTASTVYVWVFLGVGLLTLAGGMIGLVRWLKKQGLRDAQLDKVIMVVLGDDGKNIPSLVARFDQIALSMQSNGLNTNQVGDIAKRTENAVDRLHDKFSEHVGESRHVHKMLWKAIDAIDTEEEDEDR